jgi:uncharacterized protein (TIGR00290 family)
MQTLLSWSSGKDCAYTLARMRASHPELLVVGLLTTFNETTDPPRVAMHATRLEVCLAQAKAVGLPLWRVDLPAPCSNEEYGRRMKALIREAKARGIQAMAYGDLHLEDVRKYREVMLEGTGIAPVFPIWLSSPRETRVLACEMIDAKCRAVLVTVDPKQLGEEFAGRWFTKELLHDFPESVDWCGEKGEFHSVAVDGPAFAYPLDVRVGASSVRDKFVFTELELAREFALAEVVVHIDAHSVREEDAQPELDLAKASALMCPSTKAS